jgi:hypothetical protein
LRCGEPVNVSFGLFFFFLRATFRLELRSGEGATSPNQIP